VDQNKLEVGEPQSKAPGRAEKRLARGLEDVSHLFLSPVPDEAASEARAPDNAPDRVTLHRKDRSDPIVLAPSAAPGLGQLVTLLTSNSGILEAGLKIIDATIPCESGGLVDLLAVDSAGQLVIIDLNISAGEELLLRGIGHFDWFVRNIPIVRRMYHGHVINFSLQPKLFLVAPSVSPQIQCAARRITSPEIKCFQYRVAAVPNGTGILFESA
jgi:hypothetical protein